MQIVKAERWHKVEPVSGGSTMRHCSVCGSRRLAVRDEPVLDGSTRARYRVVRCDGCGYDLLEPLPAELAGARR